MIAALLCPGPSLSKFTGHGRYYDFLIGVNRAVLLTPCDWWSFGDTAVFREVKPINRPRIWTRATCRDEIGTDPADDHRVMVHEDYFDRYPTSTRWTKYSALAALVLADILGVRHLDCYGVDMAGDAEFDGQPLAGVRRDRNRWADESHWWAQTVAMLEGRGMTIERVRMT